MIQSEYESLKHQGEIANNHMATWVQLQETTWWEQLLAPTTIVAIIVAVLAGVQWRTAEKQRKQEIFQKRWELYTRIFDLYYQRQTMGIPITNEQILPYANEANFLFGKEIAEHIMGIVTHDGTGLDYDWLNKPFEKFMRIR